jgi:subtilase family serine protease
MKFATWAAFGAAMLFGVSGANSQTFHSPVQRSGRVFHVAVCGNFVAPGQARCFAHVVTDARGNIIANTITRNATPAGYGPVQLRSAYKINPTGNPGTGPTIAIVDAYGYSTAEADLGVYRQQYGLGACTTANGCFKKVDQNGGTAYPRNDTGWSQETALDLDMVSAMCPECKIVLVEATSSSLANLAAAEQEAAKLGAHAISNSYGGSEGGTTSYNSAYNHPGIAITVSSGDSGYGVQFPASSPYVTAVGGTSLTTASNSRGWSETAWSGAGSGCSTVYAQPTWQSDAYCNMRMVADVSAVADPNTGVAVYGPVTSRRSGWQVYGGTSVAAPLTAAIYGVNGGSVNYGQNPYLNTSALFDVTSGSNGSCGGTNLCTAGPGLDGPTGLGTPNGAGAY